MTENKQKQRESLQLLKWQNKLLPFLIIVPSVLMVLFIGVSTWQINSFTEQVNKNYTKTVRDYLPSPCNSSFNKNNLPNTDYFRLVVLAEMEEQSLSRRYHQASMLLMSRIFVKYLGFLTGMIMAIVGAVFVTSKLSEKSSDIEGSFAENFRIKILTSSPGFLFGFLGTILMLTTILKHDNVVVQDSPLYLNAASLHGYNYNFNYQRHYLDSTTTSQVLKKESSQNEKFDETFPQNPQKKGNTNVGQK